MGYRSDLVVLIYPDAGNKLEEQALYDQLKVLMATTFKATIDGTSIVDGFASCMKWLDADHVLKFDILDVKWYPSYPDVQRFEAMLSTFDGEISGYCTEFVRIGEESGDVEERRTGENNQYYLNVRQSVECNV